jgi:uncharacterized protein YbcI
MDQSDQRGDSPAKERRLTVEQERERIDLSGVSNAMVKLYKEQFGRGPTKARSDLAGPDTLICTLEDSLTPAERNMVKAGEHQRLRDLRMYFQHASEKDFISTVEGITGRTVRSFTSGMDVQQDLATEAFYFEPIGTPSSHADRSSDELSP